MQVERINPEVVLKAAQMARSGYSFSLTDDGRLYASKPEDNKEFPFVFDPINFDSDAWALMYALLELGWRFRYENGGSLGPVFWAEQPHTTLKIWSGELNRLMLCAVSAQCAIPLYLEKT